MRRPLHSFPTWNQSTSNCKAPVSRSVSYSRWLTVSTTRTGNRDTVTAVNNYHLVWLWGQSWTCCFVFFLLFFAAAGNRACRVSPLNATNQPYLYGVQTTSGNISYIYSSARALSFDGKFKVVITHYVLPASPNVSYVLLLHLWQETRWVYVFIKSRSVIFV